MGKQYGKMTKKQFNLFKRSYKKQLKAAVANCVSVV